LAWCGDPGLTRKLDFSDIISQFVKRKATKISYHDIISHHIVVLERQNRLKVGTDKSKLQVKMQSVSDDDVLKRLLEKSRFELAAKGAFGLWEDVTQV